MGAAVEEQPDGLAIDGGRRAARAPPCASHGDHRIAMALAVAAPGRGRRDARSRARSASSSPSPSSSTCSSAAGRPSGDRRAAPRRVVLVGFMGAGKTHGGPPLAARCWAGTSSTSTTRSRRAPACTRGRDLPRRRARPPSAPRSSAAAARAAAPRSAVVIAAGGGAFAQPETREVLAARARSRSGCAATSTRCSRASRPTAVDRWPANRETIARTFRRAGASLPPRRPGGRHDAAALRETWRARSPSAVPGGPRGPEDDRAMKYLILSDIHSNQEALTAVLSFVRRKPLGQGRASWATSSATARTPTRPWTWCASCARWSPSAATTTRSAPGIEDGELFNRMALEAAHVDAQASSRASNLRVAEEAARRARWWWTTRSPSATARPSTRTPTSSARSRR